MISSLFNFYIVNRCVKKYSANKDCECCYVGNIVVGKQRFLMFVCQVLFMKKMEDMKMFYQQKTNLYFILVVRIETSCFSGLQRTFSRACI